MQVSNYNLDLTRFGHIWFSDTPEESLPALNKIRLILNRALHPLAQITLIFSSRCLSSSAMRDLASFAAGSRLQLVDFDTDLQSAKKSSLDKEIYDIADAEIQYCREGKGGNMRSASDCVRALEPVVRLCGNYVDCDVGIDVRRKEATHRVQVPIVLGGGIVHKTLYGLESVSPAIQNHFLGIATTSEEDKSPHPDALALLDLVKAKILRNYRTFGPHLLLQEFEGAPNITALNHYLASMARTYSQNASIFAYRRAILQADMDPEARHLLLKDSVLNISGTTVWFSLFPDLLKDLFVGPVNGWPVPDLTKWELLKKRVVACSYITNGLSDAVITGDRVDNPNDWGRVGVRCDLSWTPMGRQLLQDRSDWLQTRIQAVQSACRSFLARRAARATP